MGNKRRPQGEGMVRKREDGRWEGRIVIGHKKDGRASVLLLVPFIVYLLFQLFICFLWYSLAYGEWKN